MIKLTGALLVFISCVIFGALPTIQLLERMELLRQLIQDLDYLQAELRAGLPSVPELMELLSENGGPRIRAVCSRVSAALNAYGAAVSADAWSQAVSELLEELSVQEQAALCGLGRILGRYCLEDELSAIQGVTRQLQTGLSETRQRYAQSGKLSISLGAAAGAFFVILFV